VDYNDTVKTDPVFQYCSTPDYLG